MQKNIKQSEDKVNLFITFLKELFENYNNAKINYCVLRNYEEFNSSNIHDIDIITLPYHFDQLVKILDSTAEKYSFLKVNSFWKEGHLGVRFFNQFYSINKNNGPLIILFEISTSVIYKFIEFLSADIILKNKVSYNNFYIPSQLHESLIFLIKPFYESTVRDKYKARINKIAVNYNSELKIQLKSSITKKISNELVDLAVREKYDDISFTCKKAKCHLQLLAIFRNPYKAFFRLLFLISQKIARVFFPKGMVILLFGNNSLIQEEAQELYINLSKWYQPSFYKYISPSEINLNFTLREILTHIIPIKTKSGLVVYSCKYDIKLFHFFSKHIINMDQFVAVNSLKENHIKEKVHKCIYQIFVGDRNNEI